MHHRTASFVLLMLCAMAVLALGAVSALASQDPGKWTGLGADDNWSTPANWQGQAVPSDFMPLTFPAGVTGWKTTNNDLTGPLRYSITILDSGFTLEGNPIELTVGLTANYASGTSTISFDMALPPGAPCTITVPNAGSTLDLAGDLSGGDFTLFGYKYGLGTLKLDGDNTFADSLMVSEGTVLATSDTALGTTAGTPTVLQAGSQLALQGDLTVAEPIDAAGPGPLSGTIFADGDVTLSGPLTTYDLTSVGVAAGKTLTIAGAVDNQQTGLGGVFTCLGPGSVQFTNDSNVWGALSEIIDVESGTLDIAAAAPVRGPLLSAKGGAIRVSGGVTLENMTWLRGAGAGGAGALQSIGGDNVLSGPVFMPEDCSIGVPAGSLTIYDLLANFPFTLTKVGSGPLIMRGAPTFQGSIDVAEGTLQVDGTLSSETTVTIQPGASLEGTGTVGNLTVASGATLAPGTSPGQLTVGGLTLNSGSTYEVELDGTTAGTGYDQTVAFGPVSLGGATLSVLLGFTPVSGDVFTIIRNDSGQATGGTFAGLPEGALISVDDRLLQISYVGGASTHDVTLTDVTPSPHTITATSGPNGSISPAGEVVVDDRSTPTFSFRPATGYLVKQVLVGGVPTAMNGRNSYTFPPVTADTTIAVEYEKQVFAVTALAMTSGGSVSPAGTSWVPYGDCLTVRITPAEHYVVSRVTVDGRPVTLRAGTYTFTNVTRARRLEASFALESYTITSSVVRLRDGRPHGTISPDLPRSYVWGSTPTFVFRPDPGYAVFEVRVDGRQVLPTPRTSYTFPALSGPHTISVRFAKAYVPAPQ